MLDKWTGTVVSKMHVYEITQQELADELGVTKGYVSSVLHQKVTPKNAKQRVTAALDAILARKTGEIETR